MAGFLLDGSDITSPNAKEFHIGDFSSPQNWMDAFHFHGVKRVATIQVDEDELHAVVWGLANYRKIIQVPRE